MKRYRVVEYEHCKHKIFEVQKKSMFGFWYNPDNVDGNLTGCYDTLKEAKEIIESKLAPINKRIVYESPL